MYSHNRNSEALASLLSRTIFISTKAPTHVMSRSTLSAMSALQIPCPPRSVSSVLRQGQGVLLSGSARPLLPGSEPRGPWTREGVLLGTRSGAPDSVVTGHIMTLPPERRAALFSRAACAPLKAAVFCSRIPLASFFCRACAKGHRPEMRPSGVKLPLTPSVHFLITVYGGNVIAASVV